MIVNREEFVTALGLVLPATTGGSALSGAERVTASKGKLYATNDAVSIVTKFAFPEELEFCVKAQELYQTLKRFEQETIDISLKEEILHLKSGKAKATMAVFPVLKNSPMFFAPPVLLDMPADYFDAIRASHIAGNKHRLGGIFFEGKEAMSTDGKRITHTVLSEDSPRFWINDTCAKVVLRYGNIFTQYGVSPSHVWFVSKGEMAIAVKRLNDEAYSDKAVRTYYESCKEEAVGTLDIPAGLLQAIQRAAPFTTLEQAVYPVRLSFMPNGIEVSTKTGSDSYEELVEFEDDLPIDENTIDVDYSQLLYGIQQCPRMGIVSLASGQKMLGLYNEFSVIMLATLQSR